MDLIATLSSQLGLAPNQAEGLAGGLLGKLEEQVSAKLGGADATALRSGLPELEGWKAQAASLGAGEGGGGGLGGLLGAAGGLLGGATGLSGSSAGGLDLASLVQLASKVGLTPGAAQALVPVVLSFLQTRLDPALLARIMSAVPALSKLAGNKGSGGGLLGALGGILGG